MAYRAFHEKTLMTEPSVTVQELNNTIEALKAQSTEANSAEQQELLEALALLLSSTILLDSRVKDVKVLASAIQNRAAGRPVLKVV